MERDGVLAVEAGGARTVFKRQANIGEVTERDDPVPIDFDGQVVDVLLFVEGRRDFDGEGTGFGFYFTGGNQLVVVGDNGDQLACGDVVGFQAQRVDDDFDHFIAVTSECGLKDGLQAFEAVLKVFGDTQKGAFGQGARQVHDDDGEFREVEFVDGVLVGTCGELSFGLAHGVAHVGHDFCFVPAKLEFNNDEGIAFGGRAGHGFQAVEVGKLGLHRANKQFFTVFRGDARKGDRYKECRDFDVGFAFFGEARIGERPCHKRQNNKGDDHAGTARSPIDDPGH